MSNHDHLEVHATEVDSVLLNGETVYGDGGDTEYATQADLDALEQTHEDDVTALGEDHDSLVADVDGIADAVTELEAVLDVVEGDIGELQQTTDDQGGELADHGARLEAVESTLDDVQSTLESVESRLDDLEAEAGLWGGHELVVGDQEPTQDAYVHLVLGDGEADVVETSGERPEEDE